MVGLQGSGKTTTAAKIALRLKNRERKKVLLASLDVQRPAAQEQLAQLGRSRSSVATLPIVAGQTPGRDRPARAWSRRGARATTSSCSTPPAGCTIDEELMAEVAAVREARAARTRRCWSSTR